MFEPWSIHWGQQCNLLHICFSSHQSQLSRRASQRSAGCRWVNVAARAGRSCLLSARISSKAPPSSFARRTATMRCGRRRLRMTRSIFKMWVLGGGNMERSVDWSLASVLSLLADDQLATSLSVNNYNILFVGKNIADLYFSEIFKLRSCIWKVEMNKPC